MQLPLFLLVRLQYLQELLVSIGFVRKSNLDLVQELNGMVELPGGRLLHSPVSQVSKKVGSSRLRAL